MGKIDREKERRQRQWEAENSKLKAMRAKAPEFKRFLRAKGCDLPFDEYMDSYEEEFSRIAAEAKSQYPTLAGVHEVDDKVYYDSDWAALGYGQFKQIMFGVQDTATDYGKHESTANVCGYTAAFRDEAGGLRTVVMVRRR